MGIGDFAMSLMESGQITKGTSTEVARPTGLPKTDVDISDVSIPSSMVEQVLQESFGMDAETPRQEQPKESLLSEQELLQEKIISLREELVDTINKLTELVSEMAGMGMTSTQSIGTGYSSTNVTGKYRGRNKSNRNSRRKIRRKEK